MYYAILLCFLPLLIGLGMKTYKHIKNNQYIFLHIIISNIIMNSACLMNNDKSIINYVTYSPTFFIFYVMGCILCSFLSYELYTWIRFKKIHLYRKSTLFFALLFINCFVYFSWLLGEAGRQSFDLFLYNLYSPVNTDVANFNIQLTALLIFICVMNISVLMLFQKNSIFLWIKKKQEVSIKQRHWAKAITLVFLVLTLLYPVYSFHLEDAYAYYTSTSTLLSERYVNPNEVTLTWPDKKRNLIYIFMESFESSSFSKDLGGLNDSNLLPNLSKRMSQGVSFSNHEDPLFGGLTTMPLAGVTLSGMITSLSGVNNQIPNDMSEDNTYAVLPSITTLHDVLAQVGYQPYFVAGTDIEAYHIGPFHRAHGNTIATGLNERIANGQLPEDYHVWWGFEDKKLYEFAKEDLGEISKQETPFFYMINTNDTHRVGGYTDPSCPVSDYPYDIQNAIGCADYMVNDFIEWFTQQPFYDNTTLVIVGDHLAHKEDYTTTLPEKDRRIFNLFLNAKSPEQNAEYYNRSAWAGDLFPTVLSSLGVEIEGNRLGLGTNLFSNTPSLLEEYGVDYLSGKLLATDPYFVENFLLPN